VSRIDELISALEQAALQLRGGELEPEAAAAVVEDCARLANELSAELDREARAAGEAELPGQEPLL
jgi:hypothetical protein